MSLNEIHKFKKTGFHKFFIKDTHKLLDIILKTIEEDKNYQNIYPNTLDFVPTIRTYDKVFMDILFKNNIPKIINQLTGLQLRLANINLRVSNNGPRYQNWHRDRYFYGSPGYKIFFYPNFNNTEFPVLSFVDGPKKNIKFIKSRKDKLFNKVQIFFDRVTKKNNTIFSNNNYFNFINTSILHAPEPVLNNRKGVRLIYFFCQEHQMKRFQDPLDIETSKIYLNKII